MQALAEMAGLNSSVFDALRLDENSKFITSLLNAYLEEGDELRSRLKAWAARQAEMCWENVSYIKKHVGFI